MADDVEGAPSSDKGQVCREARVHPQRMLTYADVYMFQATRTKCAVSAVCIRNDMCPHTTVHVSSYLYIVCPHTTIDVPSYYYICVLILL